MPNVSDSTYAALTLTDAIKERVLVLDGAMGTMIMQRGLTEADFRAERFAQLPGVMKGNNDILNLTRPDVIEDIHRQYLDAGADIITANTFSAQTISMADYGVADCAEEICAAGCDIARRLADEYTQRDTTKPRFVVGTAGPTNRTCSISPDINNPAARNVTFDQLATAYQGQMCAMITHGVDGILIETIFDTLNAKAAIFAARQAMKKAGRDVPLMLSMTVSDMAGHTLSGQEIEAFLISVEHAGALTIGMNCSFGTRQLMPFVRIMAERSPTFVSLHPNAGLPNAMGEYEQTPQQFADEMQACVNERLVNIIGGCCGTTPEHIRLLAQMARHAKPHVPPSRERCLRLAGLQALELTPQLRFVNIGERCNVAGSRKFLRLISEHHYDLALDIARKQVEDGAMMIDINMDDGLLDAPAEMTHFVNLLMSDPDIARVPLMIDSSDFGTIRAALKCIQGKVLVNSISLKEGEAAFLSHAREVRQYGAAVIVMAFDETGQATTYDRKVEICRRAYGLLVEKAGFPPEDIVFDPAVLTVGTGIADHALYALDFIRATEWIRKNLPYAHVSGGVSNLSFAFRGNNPLREAMHAVFLYHTIAAGQDLGIINPSTTVTYEDVAPDLAAAIDDLLFNRRDDATDRLLARAQEMKGSTAHGTQHTASDVWRTLPNPDDRLKYALIHGVGTYLEKDVDEALMQYADPLQIIQGPLLDAMNEVGELFATGKMFLPQVIKTARTMKQAVALIQPHLSIPGETAIDAPAILIATVKGDVHDIGKNIVATILACNNYRIIDLGTMVPAETIIAAAMEQRPAIIALSGLITPSLDEMANVARQLQRTVEAGHLPPGIPLMIGGATTSALHTALHIAPLYPAAPVLWMKDASQNPVAAARLLDPDTAPAFIAANTATQQRLRDQYNQQSVPLVSLDEARAKKPHLFS